MPRWRVFLYSMLITLFCLVPLYLLVIGNSLFGVQPADRPLDDVPVLTPGPQDSLTLLLVLDAPDAGAALVRLDAWQRRAECLVLPGNTLLPVQGQTMTLADCCAQAGPLQLRAALEETLGGGCERYLCLSTQQLAEVFAEFSPMLQWDDLGPIRDLALLRRFAFNGGEGALTSSTATLLVRQCRQGEAAVAGLRAVLYQAFLQEGLPALTEPVGALLRSDDQLLTDITAVDLYGVERLFELLAADPPPVSAGVPTGHDTAAGWKLDPAGLRQLRQLLDLSEEEPATATQG